MVANRASFAYAPHAELTAYLESQPGRFDFVVCADTFIYFGDLAPLARAFAFALAPGGHLVFSAEERPAQPGRAPGYDLLPSGRYHHDRAYAEAVSRDAGLEVAAVEAITVRTENGVPLPGFVMTVVRPA